MINVTINGTEYHICNTWNEVDLPRLYEAEDFREDLMALSNIPDRLIMMATEVQLFPLYTIISFIDDLSGIDVLEAKRVGQDKYERMEMAKTILQSDIRESKKLLKIAEVYYEDELKDPLFVNNPVRLLGLGADIVAQIAKFLSHYKDMFEHEPEMDEEAAGIDGLSLFGSFGTVYNLAAKDITKLRTIYAMPAIEVYTALHYSYREGKYLQELHKIKNRRA